MLATVLRTGGILCDECVEVCYKVSGNSSIICTSCTKKYLYPRATQRHGIILGQDLSEFATSRLGLTGAAAELSNSDALWARQWLLSHNDL